MKRTYILIFIYTLILIIGHILFFKNTINFSINFSYPFSLEYYISFLSIVLGSFFGIYKWLDLRDLQEEKEKHLGYIRTINDRIGKKIDGNFFTDIEKAKKFCNKEEYYILPFGFKYNISNIDFYQKEYNATTDKDEEKIEKYKNLNLQEILNDEEIIYQREFIDFDKYVKNLDLHGENKFNKDSKIIVENYIEKNKLEKDSLINLFENGKDFVIIEGYCYLYKF